MRLTLCARIVFVAAPAFASTNDLSPRLQNIRDELPAEKARLDNLKSKGTDIAYPLVTYTVLDNFTLSSEIIPPGKTITLAPLQVRLLRTRGLR